MTARSSPGSAKTLNCAQAGTRVVGVVPAAEAFGARATRNCRWPRTRSWCSSPTWSSIVPTKAEGEAVAPPAGLPDGHGRRRRQADAEGAGRLQAAGETQIATLIKGAGAVVGPTDTILIQYQGTNLATGKIFDQTWGKSPYSGAANGFVPGFTNAIVGQTVGSQVLVVIAPADGYGPQGGNSGAGIGKDDTMVFVIDILAAETHRGGLSRRARRARLASLNSCGASSFSGPPARSACRRSR